ncbi:AUGMIN subunit 6 isoform X2 [Apium graveolens]|uniref:AUGMIN subunit 6 isoform X2 n=1 Tax=Apium graveolens TaxID=4045 RepID=UPI003D7A214D
MTMDREKEREIELESTMYTNCLLLGLDPSVLGTGATHSVGLFRHSNPKLGEQLLYFILSSLRGPIQSAKDFDKVWPIFDSAQSRDFRKVVQGIINELESQGALPRSNSRVSSLATCCGPRFVELLWQLSLHALREVHRRTFAADVASNPLPASLTDVAFSHAATLLPVTKAKIALERRKFLKNAEMAVQRQTMWSNLAHEMTAEFRGLCAEEAYLQQELEKLQDLRNKVKMEGEHWDELVSSSSQNSHMVQRATRLWESLESRKNQHEVLASGPIEDLIAHREHRYRISGSSLLAAMDQSTQLPLTDLTSAQSIKSSQTEGPEVDVNRGMQEDVSDSSHLQGNDVSRVDDRNGRGHTTVDIAEVLRRWTHALQRIHKQSLVLAKTNDGEGPELLRSTNDGCTGHSESLVATLSEHRQHLTSIQVLINQLKEVAPAIQNSISELTEEVNSVSANIPLVTNHHGRSSSPNHAQSTGRQLESSSDEVSEMTSRLSTFQIEKNSASPTTLKLPPLFSLTPNSGKGGNMQKRDIITHANQSEFVTEKKSVDKLHSNNPMDRSPQGKDYSYVQNLKRSVREAALSTQACKTESSQESHSDDGSESFFLPLSGTGFSRFGAENKSTAVKSKKLASHADTNLLQDYNRIDDFLSASASNEVSDVQGSLFDLDEAQVFSPPLLMDTSMLSESYEDLLAPLSDTEAALMNH